MSRSQYMSSFICYYVKVIISWIDYAVIYFYQWIKICFLSFVFLYFREICEQLYLYWIVDFSIYILFQRSYSFSESKTIEDFGETLHLDRHDIEHLRSVFLAVENGDLGMLKSLGIKDSEIGDVKFFLEKLVNTGFLD